MAKYNQSTSLPYKELTGSAVKSERVKEGALQRDSLHTLLDCAVGSYLCRG